MTAPSRFNPAPLAVLPLVAGVGGWVMTSEWRWAVLGLLGLLAAAVVLAVVRPGGQP